MVALFGTTRRQLNALSDVVTPQAHRHPDTLVPPLVEADARAVLAAARRVLSREPGLRGRLELRGALHWTELSAKLALALSALGEFKARYYSWDRLAGEYAWTTEPNPSLPLDAPTLIARTAAQLEQQITALEQKL
jgi:hypothetical protein